MALMFPNNNKLTYPQQVVANQIQGKPAPVNPNLSPAQQKAAANVQKNASASAPAPAQASSAPAADAPKSLYDYVTTGNANAGSGSTYKDTTAARGATQQSINALDTASANNLAAIMANYQRILQQYQDEEAINKQNYNEQVASNEQTRENTIQAALLAAAQGGRGLRSTLASVGAFNGDGVKLARRAVADSANKDIGAGNETFDKNATQLYTAYATTQRDEKNRRAEAEAAKANEERAAKSAALKEKQSLYEKMAGLWADAGNNGEANRYLGLVGSLAPEIANYAGANTASYTPRSVLYNPGQLSSYLAGANDMTVKTSGGNNKSSTLYTTTRKREELL